MEQQRVGAVAESLGRLLVSRPERIAEGWRKVRWAQTWRSPVWVNQLDGLVEPLVQELGRALLGTLGSPWSRCGGVLRLSAQRGATALKQEFAALRQCLMGAAEALHGGAAERAAITSALEEAQESALALLARLDDPLAEMPPTAFGGLVVELFERQVPPRGSAAEEHRAALH